MKIEKCTLSNILLKFNFKEVDKYSKDPNKKYFKKGELLFIINEPDIIYSNNIYDCYLSESNLIEEFTSIIYYTQLIKKDRETLIEKLHLRFNELKEIYSELKKEIEIYPQYSLLSKYYIEITKLKKNIEKAIE